MYVPQVHPSSDRKNVKTPALATRRTPGRPRSTARSAAAPRSTARRGATLARLAARWRPHPPAPRSPPVARLP